MEDNLVGVLAGGKQDKEATKYGAEPAVWTPSMIRALEEGVRGGKWFSLIDKVERETTLERAWEGVKGRQGCAGIDRETISQFERNAAENLQYLRQLLKDRRYQPQPVKRVEIPKEAGKTRPLGIPTVRDRIVQNAIRMVIEPIFEREFSENSFGFRPNRKAHDALRRVEQMLEQGQRYIVDADIKSFFDTIPHGLLMGRVKEKIADSQVLNLIESYLKQRVMESAQEWTPVMGTPQGAVLSPLLANVYLHSLDKSMEACGNNMTRYADDFVIACDTLPEAQEKLEMVKNWMLQNGLQLQTDKTRIVDMTIDGGWFEFLGYRFERRNGKDYQFPRKKSLAKLRQRIRDLTPSRNGQSLEAVIKRVNATARGWYNYFIHCWSTTFKSEDQFNSTTSQGDSKTPASLSRISKRR